MKSPSGIWNGNRLIVFGLTRFGCSFFAGGAPLRLFVDLAGCDFLAANVTNPQTILAAAQL
jgi:hypothetical protein